MKKTLRPVLLALTAAVCLTVSALAVPEEGYYTFLADDAGLLTEAQADALEAKALDITYTYGFAPYIITVDSLNGVDVDDLAMSYWDEYSLGYGDQREGALLLMSMEDRDFSYTVHDYTNAVFDQYRFDSVQQAFLADFRHDDWYGGFTSYLDATEHYLSGAADDVDVEAGEDYNYYGDYVPDYGREERRSGPSLFQILLIVLVPCAVAGIVCMGLASSMKSVRHASYAGNYVAGRGLNLRLKEDVFTHRTETRTKIERDHDHGGGGGGGHGGGGGGDFSSSGKF